MRRLFEKIFRDSLAMCDAGIAVAANLPPPPLGRTFVCGAGKGVLVMAEAFAANYPAPFSGIVIAPHDASQHSSFPRKRESSREQLRFSLDSRFRGNDGGSIEIRRGSHPLPDESGVAATREILTEAESLGPDDLLVALISGGGSALLTAPRGITLAGKREVIRNLLESGATIEELNAVRKKLSAVKGGGLAKAAWPARVVSLIVSDVVGDDLSVIASGPTVPESENPKHDPVFDKVENRLILSNAALLKAARRILETAGYRVVTVEGETRGEARDEARRVASLVSRLDSREALLFGGELTVTVSGKGRGGPNMEFLLALLLELGDKNREGLHAFAADTDGSDGSTSAAGAFLSPETPARDAAVFLDANDSLGFFEKIGGIFAPGPTGMNLNDLRIALRE